MHGAAIGSVGCGLVQVMGKRVLIMSISAVVTGGSVSAVGGGDLSPLVERGGVMGVAIPRVLSRGSG